MWRIVNDVAVGHERGLISDVDYDRILKTCRIHDSGDTLIPFGRASAMIEWLGRRLEAAGIEPGKTRPQSHGERQPSAGQPARPATPRGSLPRRPDGKPAPPAVYERGDHVYVVREAKDRETGRTFIYARELIELRESQQDRLSGDGHAVRYEEAPAKGMQWSLLDSELMPMARVEALSLKRGHCLQCGHKVWVKKSVLIGIGPVCRGRQEKAIAARDAHQLPL